MHPAHALGRRITYHPTNLRTLLDSFSSWPRKISANHTPSSHLLQPTSRSLHPSPSTLNTNPLPSSIREAWNAGLSGTHPNQYSRLRAKATTITYPDPPPAISSTPTPSQQTSASTEQNTSVPCHSSLQPKRTLLQTYLSWVFPLCLDKRSQRYVSIAIFIWAFSGFAYFTWFSEPPLPVEKRTKK